MAFHHLALATADTRATDRFYREVMGFELKKVEVGPTPDGGWSRHFFYDTGDGSMIAFWELHDDTIPADAPTAISTGLGFPTWVNHVAFRAGSRKDLDAHRIRWVANGYDVLEVDHEWCISVYTNDPNGTMVEFCYSTREFSEVEVESAPVLLSSTEPPMREGSPKFQVFEGEGKPLHLRPVAA